MSRKLSCVLVVRCVAMAIATPVVALAMLPQAAADPPDADPKSEVLFNRDVRPILSANCFACHGFDEKKRQAELRLDVVEGALADLGGHAAIKPGDPSGSELWARINSTDPDVVMPPPATKKVLTAEQKETLRRWIEQGAPYQKHWAFETPVRRATPNVTRQNWTRNAIDHFILGRLEQEALEPQPEADRETLIRRVAFTLTGLPPTIAEVDTFLKDEDPRAYESMVDRYLASPHFGEEQARVWLDVARYADTHGLHLDNEREMWAYRDWVVKAYNDNLPFDQFTIWQLAGDLLPDPTQEQLVATGFNRCNVSTSEGGSIAAEWVFRNAVDRTSTMVQTFLGLTGGCAVCHSHKFDPLTQHEFYSLYAFFYSAADPGLDGNIRDTNPFLKVPTPEQTATLKAKEDEVAAARRLLDENLAQVDYQDPAQQQATGAETPDEDRSQALRPIIDSIIDDDFPFGARDTNTSRNAASWVLEPKFGAPAGRRVLELASSGEYEVSVQLLLSPVVAPLEGRLEFSLRVDPDYPPAALSLKLDGAKSIRRAVWGDEQQLSDKSEATRLGDVPEAGVWHSIAIPMETLGFAAGTRVKSIVIVQTGGRIWVDDIKLAGQTNPAEDPLSSFTAWWRASKGSKPPELPAELTKLLDEGPEKECPPEQRAQLLRFYMTHIQRLNESPVKDLRLAWYRAELDRKGLEDLIPGTFIFRELEQPREAFVMQRGQYDKPGEKVEPGVPAIFPPLERVPETNRATRLDLARWLVSPAHPLTARVAVNRMWQQVFGLGLVKTSYDFGSQGDVPSHPELLDWLAVEFRENGWNTKELFKLLLTSASFRQRTVVTPELLQRDPENRLLARGPRFRLDAEQIRDNALFVSGLLDPRMGGRGVLPYQPPNIWEPVGYQNSNTRFYMQGKGADLYRRSLYCFLKRTAPPPFMSNFDGPNREQVCARRERSNTPLQALQLMNDVQHFEAARALAERAIAEAGPTVEERTAFLYRSVLSRRPSQEEIALIGEAYQVQYDLFAADPGSAEKAVRVGESAPRNLASAEQTAAWTMIANLILNLDETVTRN